MQRRIIVSLTACPQVPPGRHFDLGNFISQLRQIETHRGVDGSAGEEDEDESCSAELWEEASHPSKRLTHHQKTLNWSFDPRCLPGDVGGVIEDGLDRHMRLTSFIRLLIGWTMHIRSSLLTAGLHLSDTRQLFKSIFAKDFNFWVTLLYHPENCNNNNNNKQIWLNAPIYLYEGK